MKYWFFVFCLISSGLAAQNRALHIALGTNVGLLAKENKLDLSPRPGFLLGLEYWAKNQKGNFWSAGVCYAAFSRSREDKKETFEYLNVYSMPLMWPLGNKNQWFVQGGLFGNFLLGQSLDDNGNVTNSTKKMHRLYVGPSLGLAARLGQDGRSKILLGLRNDYGAISFGSGTAQRFNTISLMAGIEL